MTQRLVIQKITHEQEQDGNKGALYDKTGVYLPACLICIKPAAFQTDDRDSEHNACPVYLSAFLHKICLRGENKVQNPGGDGAGQIGNRQRGKGMNGFGCRFCADMVKKV